ncbi:hypothetical protein CDCA_CDCA06G1872 [Cyanidium caldarium]|uniref:Uncharacterized protein n=1 Tax=Cyanidium caldarium TaxID=2771 RepID=A0AAV9IU59_CYACA|nr:hypothetical protein CDCA_CDCA06G1872 [Cyanidium caldarium]
MRGTRYATRRLYVVPKYHLDHAHWPVRICCTAENVQQPPPPPGSNNASTPTETALHNAQSQARVSPQGGRWWESVRAAGTRWVALVLLAVSVAIRCWPRWRWYAVEYVLWMLQMGVQLLTLVAFILTSPLTYWLARMRGRSSLRAASWPRRILFVGAAENALLRAAALEHCQRVDEETTTTTTTTTTASGDVPKTSSTDAVHLFFLDSNALAMEALRTECLRAFPMVRATTLLVEHLGADRRALSDAIRAADASAGGLDAVYIGSTMPHDDAAVEEEQDAEVLHGYLLRVRHAVSASAAIMRSRGRGHIVVQVPHEVVWPRPTAPAASVVAGTAAVRAYAARLRADLWPTGIRVNLVTAISSGDESTATAAADTPPSPMRMWERLYRQTAKPSTAAGRDVVEEAAPAAASPANSWTPLARHLVRQVRDDVADIYLPLYTSSLYAVLSITPLLVRDAWRAWRWPPARTTSTTE